MDPLRAPVALTRAHAAIRLLRLSGPHDGPDTFTIPRDPAARRDVADAVFDLTDQWAARAILDLPTTGKAHRVPLPPRIDPTL